MHKYNRFIIILLLISCTTTVYAVSPTLEGENRFNEIVSKIMSGSLSLNPIDIINNLKVMVINEVHESAKGIVSVISVCIVTSILRVFDGFKSKSVSQATYFACFTIICTIALKVFSIALEYSINVVMAMTDFITKFNPLFVLMLATSGHSVTAAALHPVLSGAVYVLSLIVKKWVVPLIVIQTVLSIVNYMNDSISISGFCKLIKSFVKWILALSFTLFTGICATYGFGLPAIDELSTKTMKFAVSGLVPVVGSCLSDSVDTVISGGQLMKNSVGSGAVIVLCLICLVPIVKLAVMSFMFRMCAAVSEPICEKRITSVLNEISSSVIQLFAMVVVIAMLFVICIFIILSLTG